MLSQNLTHPLFLLFLLLLFFLLMFIYFSINFNPFLRTYWKFSFLYPFSDSVLFDLWPKAFSSIQPLWGFVLSLSLSLRLFIYIFSPRPLIFSLYLTPAPSFSLLIKCLIYFILSLPSCETGKFDSVHYKRNIVNNKVLPKYYL